MTPDTAAALADLYNVGLAFERNPITADKPAQEAYRLAEETLRSLVPARICALVIATLNTRRLHRYISEHDILDAVATANAKMPGTRIEVVAPREAFETLKAALGHR